MSETEAVIIGDHKRRKYIYKAWGRYRKANKKEKGVLAEIEAALRMHRKALSGL